LPLYFFTKITFEYYDGSVQTYTLTASATEGGTISPNGNIIIGENQNKRFDFAANSNYMLSKVWVDQVENEEAVTNSYYTFNNITDNHTIHAEFAPATGNIHTITATAGAGGTVTPNGNVAVPENQNKRFEFTPDEHSKLFKVLIDNIENPQAVIDGYYLFTNVTTNHTIYAEFTAIGGFLVVYDDLLVGATIPVSTSYMDCSQHVQTIYPSWLLQSLVGKTIKKITFYTSTTSETFGGAVGSIKLMHTNASDLISGFLDVSQATEVYVGPITISNFLMSFEFKESFVYTGDNLLFDIQTKPGEPRNIIFYGSTEGYLSRYSFDFEGSHYENTHSFAPKTAFEYSSITNTYYTIVATAGVGGTIAPGGNISVLENEDKRFDFTPNANYKLLKVLVDGVEDNTALLNSYYIFNNVTANHTIYAEFSPIQAVLENPLQKVHVYTFNNVLYIINEEQIPLIGVEITDVMGRTIYHSSTVSNSIPLNLSKGVYVVRLFSNHTTLNTKIVTM
jgi:hypothetical protein